jgi:cytochrome P450
VQITPDVRLAACSADPAATYRAASGAVSGLRVVGADADVDEILGSGAWLVVPPSAPDPRAQALLAKTARFSEGREHLERRAAAQALMPHPARARETARLLTRHAIADAGPFLDAMPVARHVPVATLASCLGITRDAVDRVAALVGLLRAGDHDSPERTVEETLRRDAPVQATTRGRAGTGDPPVLAWVVLAAGDATLGIAPTFGRGRHACPGHAVAAALASGVLDAFREAGWQAVPGQSVGYEPRPNLRVPHQVLLARA